MNNYFLVIELSYYVVLNPEKDRVKEGNIT